MCGIVGVFRTSAPPEPGLLERSAARLQHRGPCNTGYFTHGNYGVAHTRLSIIDLEGGDQPLFARDGQLCLAANGEVYNFVELREQLEARGHRFATQSDSEAILHAYEEYGLDCLPWLNGMFAFALYDAASQRLLLARDRLGIKPLFFAETAEGFAFGSELKPLLQLPELSREIDPGALMQYLQVHHSGGERTVLQAVRRLLPGEALCVERGRITRRWRYWTPLDVAPAGWSQEEAEERFDAIMSEVMLEHVRSDVPFGLFLSGGVDSTVLLALLERQAREPVRTFTVGFPGTAVQDETDSARALAQRFSARHHEILLDREAIFECMPLAVWAADELLLDFAALPTNLLAQQASQQLCVVFTGEGGDEVFAGYGGYRASRTKRWLAGVRSPGSAGFRTKLIFDGSWPATLFGAKLLAATAAAREPVRQAWRSGRRDWSDLQRMQYTDLTISLPDNLLVKTDRMLMCWGMEGRVPLVDHRVVEFGLALPDALKISSDHGKAFLRRWASRLIPPEQLYARKRGFAVPIREWLAGSYRQRLRELLPVQPAIREWFRPGGVRRLIDEQEQVKNAPRMLWALLQFAVWHRLLIEGQAERPEPRQDPLDLLAETG